MTEPQIKMLRSFNDVSGQIDAKINGVTTRTLTKLISLGYVEWTGFRPMITREGFIALSDVHEKRGLHVRKPPIHFKGKW